MKSIINGLLYDTQKSELLHRGSCFASQYLLYITQNKRLFLVERNALTGEHIVKRTQEELREYLGEVDPDKYIELFGEVPDA